MCILGKFLEAETYWFGNWRAEGGELFNVFMNGEWEVYKGMVSR